MKAAPFALRSPFWLHGLLYVLAAHMTGYIVADVAFILLPEDLIHLPYLFALGGCVLTLPLFFWWFFRNQNPIRYLATAVVSHIACGLAGPGVIIPLAALAAELIADTEKFNPWSFIAIWVAVALFFGALLLVLCLGLFVYALIRRRHASKASTVTEATPDSAETAPDSISETTTHTQELP